METHASRFLVCVCQHSSVSVYSLTLVLEALRLVSLSVASQSHRTKSNTDTSRSLWRVEFRRKEFLCVRANSLRAGRDSGWDCGGSRPLSRCKPGVVQVPDCRLHRLLRYRHSCATINVYAPDGAGKKKRVRRLRFAGAEICRGFRSKMGTRERSFQ